MNPRRYKETLMAHKLFVLMVGLMLCTLAQAVCYRDGRAYPTGANVGGFVCQPDGTWRRT
jgi:hypothetical protein